MENDSFQFNNSAPWFVGSWTDIQNILWKTFDSSVLKVDFKEKIFFPILRFQYLKIMQM